MLVLNVHMSNFETDGLQQQKCRACELRTGNWGFSSHGLAWFDL